MTYPVLSLYLAYGNVLVHMKLHMLLLFFFVLYYKK